MTYQYDLTRLSTVVMKMGNDKTGSYTLPDNLTKDQQTTCLNLRTLMYAGYSTGNLKISKMYSHLTEDLPYSYVLHDAENWSDVSTSYVEEVLWKATETGLAESGDLVSVIPEQGAGWRVHPGWYAIISPKEELIPAHFISLFGWLNQSSQWLSNHYDLFDRIKQSKLWDDNTPKSMLAMLREAK